VELIKGSHIVVRKLYEGNYAYILQNADERVVFAIPYENDFTLIGTTDIPYNGDMSNVTSTPVEENYLCETINSYFKKNLSAADILWSVAGVRCLQASDAANASEITRDYKFTVNTKTPLISVISGKITTYRRLAEEAVDALKPFFPSLKPAWTAHSPLPGGDMPAQDFDAYLKTVTQKYAWLPPALAYRYARSYGTRLERILQNAQCLDDLGPHIAAGLYQREVDYLQQQEWAHTSEDILWRRTKLGLIFTPADIEKLDRTLSKQT
jgi:glycerol-3-phosphate dehydrogenase